MVTAFMSVSIVVLLRSSLLSGALLMQAPAPVPAPVTPRVFARTVQVMGTDATFSAWTDDEARADRAFDAASAEISRIERLMTTGNVQARTPATRAHQQGGRQAGGEGVAETLAVIEKSLEMSKRSDGAFDITFAAMRGLWRFDEDLARQIPPDAEIQSRRKLINYRDVTVDHAAADGPTAARRDAPGPGRASPRAMPSIAAPTCCAGKG